MIWNFIIKAIVLFVSVVFYWLPEVTIEDLPYLGSSVSDLLITMIRYWNSAVETVPYLQLGMDIFIYIIIPFELLLLVAKFFLGHHVPTNSR